MDKAGNRIMHFRSLCFKSKLQKALRLLSPIHYDSESAEGPRGILPLTTDQYTDLLDWTGRQVREDKKGKIPNNLAPVLTRLDIDTENWVATVQNNGSIFHRMVGKIEAMTTATAQAGKHWRQGVSACPKAFSPA